MYRSKPRLLPLPGVVPRQTRFSSGEPISHMTMTKQRSLPRRPYHPVFSFMPYRTTLVQSNFSKFSDDGSADMTVWNGRIHGSLSTLIEFAYESESDVDDGVTSIAYSLGYCHGPGTFRLRCDHDNLHFGLAFGCLSWLDNTDTSARGRFRGIYLPIQGHSWT